MYSGYCLPGVQLGLVKVFTGENSKCRGPGPGIEWLGREAFGEVRVMGKHMNEVKVIQQGDFFFAKTVCKNPNEAS